MRHGSFTVQAEGLGVEVIAELDCVEGELAKGLQGLGIHLVALKQAQQSVEVVGQRWDLTKMNQPGLQGLLDGLLQLETPGSFPTNRRIGGSHRRFQIRDGDSQQPLGLREHHRAALPPGRRGR